MKEINKAAILKDKPNAKLWSPIVGNCTFKGFSSKNGAIVASFVDKDGELLDWDFNEYGKTFSAPKEAEVCLFPSKSMLDWSRFAWKKGDILVNNDKDVHVIFDGFEDDTYETFLGKHYLWEDKGSIVSFQEDENYMKTSLFYKANKEEAQTYINTIEERLGGKLNRETLEIEKPKKPVFEIGKLYVFDEEDEDGNVTVIGELIDKDESEDMLTFGDQYEIENEKFVTDQAFDLQISVHEELREATEGEILMLQKARTLWKKEKKAKEQPAFKPFDKVLVRCNKNIKWLPAFFVRDRGDECAWRYEVLCIHSGKIADFAYCIPYEGHENFAFTDYDFVDLPF